jgi:hypothetical protein
MEIAEAMVREKSWRESPKIRPAPNVAKMVAATLATRVQQLEEQLAAMQRLVVGRQVLIRRGNPDRGPETGPGFGRQIAAVIEEAPVGTSQVRCKLLVNDPDSVGGPSQAGESGLWSISQIVFA